MAYSREIREVAIKMMLPPNSKTLTQRYMLRLNALVHRDYSMHTEGMPVQLSLFRDRNPLCWQAGTCLGQLLPNSA